MKIPPLINVYCPFCRKHTQHKVSELKKRATRSMAWGQLKHERKTVGYTSKVAGKVRKVKQSQKRSFMLRCSACGKLHAKVWRHSKKKPEISKKE
ncbi:50S ribosomal protein L44e [Candidatus Micrarchaeota archaeon]|nr:50S ribosomal protein L44e [Candidatus Micrarchaeota archaeon]